MTPREIVYEAISFRATEVIPYIISFENEEIKRRLEEYYQGKDKSLEYEEFLVFRGVNWRGEEGETCGRFRDIFGVEWVEGNIFHIVEPVLKEPTLKGYRFPSTLIKEEEVKDIAQWCEENKDKFKVFGFGLLFWERAWALRGMENILMDMLLNPSFVHELLDNLMQLHLEALDKILHLPIDSIRFGDDFGAQRGTLMGIKHWRNFIKPRLKVMYEKVLKAGKIVSIHSCGDNSEILGELIDMGVRIFNPSQPETNDLPTLKKRFGKNIVFEGGIGTQRVLPFGTPSQVKKEVRKAREILGKGGGYIMTTAKPILPEVPVENASACIEAIIEEASKGTPD